MSKLASGLQGVVAVQSAISSIIDSTLTYRGIPFDGLVGKASFEEVVYLLWHGELPTPPSSTRCTISWRQRGHYLPSSMN